MLAAVERCFEQNNAGSYQSSIAHRCRNLGVKANGMKSAIRNILSLVGYQVQRLPTAAFVTPETNYSLCVLTLMAGLPPEAKLKCVQIGANDGKINDPLFDISSRLSEKTRLLLVEPQSRLIPLLKDNFEFHPGVRIEQVAIGDPGKLLLYGVKEEVWPNLNVPYARLKGWPTYRAPTGIVSGSREHVAGWLVKYLDDISRVDEAIECFEVNSVALASLVDSWSEDGKIDVLQIDTEGFDDYIIMSCDLNSLQPKLIHYEAKHLSNLRQEALFNFLMENGYSVVFQDQEGMALRLNSNVCSRAKATN